MRRFFVHPDAIHDDRAVLPDVESHHIATVLRLEPGSGVELFDGTGVIYQGTIETVARRSVAVRIRAVFRPPAAAAPDIILLQSLLKGKKMDLVVQKATELGIHTLQPLRTRYCEGQSHPQRQLDRWIRIMLEACKQCRREKPMQIAGAVEFASMPVAAASSRLMFWEGETAVSLQPDHLILTGPICLLLGPEGGFHTREIDLARKMGFQTVSLGGYVLRAETASFAAMAIVRYLAGGLAAPPPPF